MARGRPLRLPPPYLKRIAFRPDVTIDRSAYPMSLPFLRHDDFALEFDRAVTILVGENGVGKSTLLEAIAAIAGFDQAGGGPGYRPIDHSGARERNGDVLAAVIRASWLPKVGQGWFFRAESFFSVARYLDRAAAESRGEAPDFLSHSHGEGFLRFFEERCTRPGIFLFDEPESALSPARQFAFLKLLRTMQDSGQTQVIMATHSPVLMALPGAALIGMTRGELAPTTLEETDHYRLMRAFAVDPAGTIAAMLDG